VSLNLFVKTGKKKPNELGKVFHYDLFGLREFKYKYLSENTLNNSKLEQIECNKPHYFFRPKDLQEDIRYSDHFYLPVLLSENSLGVLSKNDDITIDFEKDKLDDRIKTFINYDELEVRKIYKIGIKSCLKKKHDVIKIKITQTKISV